MLVILGYLSNVVDESGLIEDILVLTPRPATKRMVIYVATRAIVRVFPITIRNVC